MKKRIITDPFNLKFEPFDNYGKAIKGMSWHKISYDKETGQGSYILKIDPGAKTIPHEHINYEEFYMLDGDLTDADGKTFKRGNFVTFEPGSSHSSYTEKGCLILVFMRSRNKTI
jgi:anti-sigma factor ChrR (cupin superfamily)